MQSLNIIAHAAQMKREPNAYTGHMPNGSAIQAHSAGEHFAAYGIIMEARVSAAGRISWVATKNSRALAYGPRYDAVLAVAISRVQH